MPSKSKRKGNGGELELCRVLTGIFGQSFTRVPNSGAIVGGLNAARRMKLSETQNRLYRGDVIPPDSLPRMVLESKFYADFPFHQLVQAGDVKLLDGWIGEAKESAKEDDTWFVAFKVNRRGWFVCADNNAVKDFELKNHVHYKSYVVTDLVDFFTHNANRVVELCG